MAAEVDKVVQGEVSVEIENGGGECKPELDSNANQDLVHGTGYGGHNNGNAKEDADGSYPSVKENDTVTSDPVVVGDRKVEHGGYGELVVESERDRADDGEKIEEYKLEPKVVVFVAKESEEPQAGDANAENGEVKKLESEQKVEESQDSQVASASSPDPEKQVSVNLGMDAEKNQEFEIAVSEDVQRGENEGKQPVDSDQEREFVESVRGEISLDSPSGDGGECLEQNIQTKLSSTISLETESVKVPVSDANADVQSDSAMEKIPAFVENGDAGTESGDVKILDSDENGDLRGSDQHGNIQSKTQSFEVSEPDENADVRLEPGAVKVLDSDQNGHVLSESRAVDVPFPDENGKVLLKSEPVSDPVSDLEGKVQLECEATGVPASDNDAGRLSETEAVGAPTSDNKVDDLVADPVEDSVLGASVANGLLDASQQLPEQNGTSGPAEILPSSAECETSQDHGLDITQDNKDEPDVQSKPEVAQVQEECSTTGHDQGSVTETNTGSDTDVCQNTSEEAKSLPPVDLSESVSVENAESHTATLNESVTASTRASKHTESSADDAESEVVDGSLRTESKDVQSDETCKMPVNSATLDESKVDIDVKDVPVENGTEVIPKDACKDVPSDDAKSPPTASSPLVDNDKMEIEVKEGLEDIDNESACSTVCVMSETETSVSGVKSEVAEPTVPCDPEVSEALAGSQTAETEVETNVTQSESRLPISPGADANKEVQVESDLSCTTDAANVTDVKVQPTTRGDSDEKLEKHEVDGEISQKGEISTSSREGSAVDASEGHNVAAEPEVKPFYFLPRVPRYDDEKLAEEIRRAQLQVDQKTQSRDAIRAEIQKIRVSCKEYDSSFKAALAEERSARDALRSKRQEIDSLQSVINRIKSVTSVEDIDARMHNMEHMIQHETLPLKEEKQLIREIKQLKQQREQISSSMGTQDEVQQALDKKDQTEESLKVLRKELDAVRDSLLKAEVVTKSARKKYDDELEKHNKLQDQFKASDAVRQEAYVHLQSLRKQSREKNKYFFKYKDDTRAANDLALKKDKEALQSFCINQVETFMNLWNNNEEFRKDYIRCNTRSTLRRLGTLDGRSRGPDEKPPMIFRATSERADKNITVSGRPEKREEVPLVSAQEKVNHFEGPRVEDNNKAVTKTGEQKNQTTKSKRPVKSAPPTSGLPTVSGREEIEEKLEEEPKLTKEEEEMIRKEEEKRKQEEEARLKEQRRLEEIAKAKDAMERKKKKEDKAKARAAVRAQKEAEEKEKEREKKLRKKERRKSIASDDTNAATEEQSAPIPETQTNTPKEIETQENKQMVTQPKKTHHKPSQFTKQSKSKSIPPPLRNRGKRKMQQWMWVTLVAMLVFLLFLLGNSDFSLSSVLRNFGF